MATAELKADLPPEAALDDTSYEIVDGRFVELPPMGARESVFAGTLAFHLSLFARANRLGRVATETLFRLREDGTLDRRPDVAFVSYERWPRSRTIPAGPAWEVVPDLAIEVVSPSNPAVEIARKVRDYFESGCRSVWVIFPEEQMFYVHESLKRNQVFILEDEIDGSPVLPGFRVAFADLFEDFEAGE